MNVKSKFISFILISCFGPLGIFYTSTKTAIWFTLIWIISFLALKELSNNINSLYLLNYLFFLYFITFIGAIKSVTDFNKEHIAKIKELIKATNEEIPR